MHGQLHSSRMCALLLRALYQNTCPASVLWAEGANSYSTLWMPDLFIHQVRKPHHYPFFPRAVLGVIPRLVFAVSLFCLPQQREFSRRHSPALSTENLSPHSGCEANFLLLLCITMAPCPRFFQPASLGRRMHVRARSEQKYSLLPHGNPSVTVTNVLSVRALGIRTNMVQSKSDILQQLNKVNCKNQKGSLYRIWFSLS